MCNRPFAVLILALACCGAATGAELRYRFGEGLRLRGEQQRWQLQVSSRLHYDLARFDSDVTPFTDGSVLRRGRVAADFDWGRQLSLHADYDFGNFSPGIKTFWANYDFKGHWTLRAGNQQAPFGLDDTASSNSSMFMERSLATALAPGILRGVTLRNYGKRWGLVLGAFGNDLADEDRRQLDGQSGLFRGGLHMVNRRRTDVAVGISAELRHAADNATMRIRARPETAVTDVRLIDTGRLRDIDATVTYGADLYASLGPVAATGEIIRLQIARTGAPDLAMQGYTVGAAWLLGGEHRGYRTSTAAMEGVSPRHWWGALELAARLSTLDLEQDLPGSGKQQDRTLALNWYWTANTRIAFNYVQVKAQPNRNGRNESPTLMQLRLQLAL